MTDHHALASGVGTEVQVAPVSNAIARGAKKIAEETVSTKAKTTTRLCRAIRVMPKDIPLFFLTPPGEATASLEMTVWGLRLLRLCSGLAPAELEDENLFQGHIS